MLFHEMLPFLPAPIALTFNNYLGVLIWQVLNLLFMSSCVCPTKKKLNYTSAKYSNPTSTTQSKHALIFALSTTIICLNVYHWRQYTTTPSFDNYNYIQYGCNDMIVVMLVMEINPYVQVQTLSMYKNST
jgi:hypothetical protein